MTENTGPLSGLRILDMTRILAGPSSTQMLGDLGCDVIKIERPGAGDDTRKWGPPYLKGPDGADTTEAAYYLSANRNKRSVTVDVARPEGQQLIRRLLEVSDVMIHNFKVGGLDKYGLGYPQLKDDFPRLIYCCISGFGQTGPYAERPGYDALAQATGGIMSITGEPDGEPMKVGVGISDIMCGMYAAVSILAALHHRDDTGRGQMIDLGLLDTQIAWLANEGMNYLISGKVPVRQGTAHPNIVPYQVFPTSDGYLYLAVGNDGQFRRFCEFAGVPELPDDPRFATNDARIRNRRALIPLLEDATRRHPTEHWVEGLAVCNVPASPVNDIAQAFDDPQVRHREMQIAMPHPLAGEKPVPMIGSPINMSETPVSYRRPPPVMGQHTDEVLEELLGLDAGERERLRNDGVI